MKLSVYSSVENIYLILNLLFIVFHKLKDNKIRGYKRCWLFQQQRRYLVVWEIYLFAGYHAKIVYDEGNLRRPGPFLSHPTQCLRREHRKEIEGNLPPTPVELGAKFTSTFHEHLASLVEILLAQVILIVSEACELNSRGRVTRKEAAWWD